jgi:hypothetical protein
MNDASLSFISQEFAPRDGADKTKLLLSEGFFLAADERGSDPD